MDHTCIGLHLDCETFIKGALVVIASFAMFIGSVYVLLAAIFGRWMGYLVLMAALSGWMVLFSALWLFGFWSQGPTTPTNLGPQGSVPSWIALDGGLQAGSVRYETFTDYPGDPWKVPTEANDASVQSVEGAVKSFLAEKANEELGLEHDAPDAITGTQFTVQNMRFAPEGGVSLAVAQAYYNGGGPLIIVTLYHDPGSVERYSHLFLVGSILLFALHLPLLDRAEKKRKEFLVGGSAPPWYGPA